MNLLMIAKSNIKKNKSMSITLVALITFASILLYIGASVLLELNTFLDDKNRSLNGADFSVLSPDEHEDTVQNILEDMSYTQLETVKAMYGISSFQNITRGDKSESMDYLFLNADKKETISKMKVIEEGDKKLYNSIILPYYLKIAKGYKTGDELTITYEGKPHTFIVYGFAEDILFAVPNNMSVYKCYVYEEQFNQLYAESENLQFRLIKTILPEKTDLYLYESDFVKELNSVVNNAAGYIQPINYASFKVGVSSFINIIMAVLVAFSMIIILIALVVMRFAIVTHIQGNIKNIGSMEALGYTGNELVTGTIIQFALLSVISIIIGLIIAISCTGFVTNLASASIGLIWNSGINLLAVLIDIVTIMLLVVVISYLTARKIKKITPIAALRSGIDTHNFKKNHFPFSKWAGNVNVTIGLKSIVQNWKQNVSILIIMTLVSFVCVFAFTSNYNFTVDNTAFLYLIGQEKPQLLTVYNGEESQKVFNEIEKMDHVIKTIRISSLKITATNSDKETTPTVSICSDFDHLEINTIVKGRYPKYDNEIAVTGLIAKRLNAKMEESITLEINGIQQEFIIVGITQQLSNFGEGAYISEEGMKKISPDYIPSCINIYLDDTDNTVSVLKAIEDRYRGQPIRVVNMEEYFDSMLASFNPSIITVCILCIAITIGIASLIIYLLIKIRLLKEKMRLGVAKALGYTTRQLMLQTIYGFCPVCILGSLLGAGVALYLVNPAFTAILSATGSIENCHMVIDPMLTVGIFLALSLYSILVTALVSRSIKKITPCELFQ